MGHISLGNFNFSWGANNFFSPQNKVQIGATGAVWMDTTKPRELYETIPQLYNPINKLAAMFSNAEVVVLDEKGKDVGTDEFYKLMQNPNFAQSLNEFLYSYLVHKLVYGNTFMYKNIASVLQKVPASIWNLSPDYVTPILTGKTFDQVNIKGVIDKYKYCEQGKEYFYDSDYVLFTKITDIDNPFVGRSPLVSLKFPLTNTKLAYEHRNVLMAKRGQLGILSPEATKDSMGGTIFTAEDRKAIEKERQENYGVQDGKSPFMVSDYPMKWMPMSFPTKDLLLFEEIDANFATILDTLGLNRNIYKDSTFENQKSGLIQTYDDTIIPHADSLSQALTTFLNIKVGAIQLKYDHLKILQTDKDKEAQTLKKQIESVVQLYEKNILNKAGAVQMLISLSGIEITSGAEDTIDRLNRLSPLVANNIIQQLLINEIRALVDAPSTTDGNLRPVAANAQFQVNTFGG